ncbi:hypothetical protein GH714_009043 [Hevea brasiliensis]|uniref:Uncharacterized protein n=1 Tax=Hevea brasiliensis TaxID=3981 RepID=A0A6A6NCW3_HEVBR|nr:hypothetical protein GH714_009043 [Hevea brasiliensis]
MVPSSSRFLQLNVDAGMSSSVKLDDFSSAKQEYVWIEDIPNVVSAVLALDVSLLQEEDKGEISDADMKKPSGYEIVGFEVVPCNVKQDPEMMYKFHMHDTISSVNCPF